MKTKQQYIVTCTAPLASGDLIEITVKGKDADSPQGVSLAEAENVAAYFRHMGAFDIRITPVRHN